MTVRGDSLMVAGDITCTPTTLTSGLSEGQRITVAEAAACITNARAVHNMAVALRPAAFLLAGDLIEPCGTLAEYQATFDPIWATSGTGSPPRWATTNTAAPRARAPHARTGGRRPSAATSTISAATAAAPAPTTPATTPFNVILPQGGHWHVVVLNSACGDYNNPPAWVTPSCTLTAAMLNWLRADLDADRARRPGPAA